MDTAVRVNPLPGSPIWEPNDPDPAFTFTRDVTRLHLTAHPLDPDTRPVTFEWFGVRTLTVLTMNEDDQPNHPLWGAGLDDLIWAGTITSPDNDDSAMIDPPYDGAGSGRPMRFLIPTREHVVDVTCERWNVTRAMPYPDLTYPNHTR